MLVSSGAPAQQTSSSFEVRITLFPSSAACGTQYLGFLIQVNCLTNTTANLTTYTGLSIQAASTYTMQRMATSTSPLVETAATTPSVTNFGNLAATAAGASFCGTRSAEGASLLNCNNNMILRSATVATETNEIEIAF